MRVAELVIRLDGMAAALTPISFASTLNKAKDWIAKDTYDCFRESRAPDGTPWAPLRPYTLAHRRFPGKPILVQTGDLISQTIQSIQQGQIDANRLTIVVANPFYAIQHQFGRPGMVARPFLGISIGVRDKVVQDAIGVIKAALLGQGYQLG